MSVSNTRSLVLLVFILASHITDVLARHHHIKLRHARHRRQHGDGYLPASFVSDTDEEESGTWGPWSAASSCSRSCGGGVADQTRSCQDIDNVTGNALCTGARKRFFTCNVQACPESTQDFRAEQCAEFNNVTIEGVLYDWIPYTGGPNKCELNCMPRGERFFYRHKVSVVDGTPCTTEGNDVCVQGKCRPVGCDMMLGSVAKEDRCRECGGDGSACNTVQGLLDMNDLQVGYTDLLLIPAGATNIAINEVRPSNNYLAIRNTTGHYYLNGNWRIDFPRSLRFAGSVFHYERRPKEFSAADIINTLGPTNEALYIVLLHQDTNVGVNYEYSIPNRFSQKSSPDSYTWVAEEFSKCSASCGGGFQSRLVRCVRRGDNENVDSNLCDQQLEPDDTQSCGVEPCQPEWVVRDWGPCSKQCKSGGEQTRQIICEQIISGGVTSIVDDLRCLDIVGPKDIEIQACNENVECPTWYIGRWKPCDHLCGKGKQTRKVTCYKKEEGKIFVLGDSACEEERPESEQDCKLRPCSGVDWVVSKWSGCDDKCGLTQETRTTSCVTLDGEVWPEEQCNAETKPKLMRECSAREKCAYQWYATQWSECSVKCGTGIQTRKVFCGATLSGSETIERVEDIKCDPSKKYNSTKDCIAEVEECKGEWFAGPWSECSKPCGSGEMTRKVICMNDNKVVHMSNCDVNDIMFSTEDCNKMACGEDGVIPVEAGTPIASTGDGEVECEDYQNDEFVSVDRDLDIVGPDNDDDRHNSFDSTSFGRGFDDLMMGDAPIADGHFGDPAPISVIDMALSDTSEGSGYGTTLDSSSDMSSFFSTLDNESTESPITSETEETIFTDVISSEDAMSTYYDKTSTSDFENTEETDGSGASELPSSETSVTSELSGSSTPLPEGSETDQTTYAPIKFEVKSKRRPPPEEKITSTTSSTESSGTSDSTSTSGSESSESLSTDEISRISGSSTIPSSEETGFTTVPEPSSPDISVSTTADTTLSPDLDASSPSSSKTSISSSADTTLSPSSDASSSSSLETETSVSSSADTTLSPISDISSESSTDTTLSPSLDASSASSGDTTLSPSSGKASESTADTTLSPSSGTSPESSADTTPSSGLDASSASSAGTTLSPSSDKSSESAADTTLSSSSDKSSESTADTTLSPSSDTSSESTADTTLSPSSGTSPESSADTTLSSGLDASSASSADTTLSPSSDKSSESTGDTTLLPSSDKSSESTADTTLSPSSDKSSESTADTTLSPSSDTSSESTADTTLSPKLDELSESTADTTLSPKLDELSESTSDTTLSPSSDKSSESTADTTLSPSSDKSSESTADTTLSPSSDKSSESTADSTLSPSSDTSLESSIDTTLSPSSDMLSGSSSDVTVSSSAEMTTSSISDATVSSSFEAVTSSSFETTQSSIEDTVVSSSSETTGLSSLDTTILSSLGPSVSSSSATTEPSSTDQTELSSSQTSASSSETVELSSPTGSAISSSDTTESSSTDQTELSSLQTSGSSSETVELSISTESAISSSETTGLPGSDTPTSSNSETIGSSSSDTTGSSSPTTTGPVGSETTVGLSSLDTTVLSSSEATESSSSADTAEPSSSTTTVLSSSDETTSGSSVSSATTESITSTDIAGSESTGSSEQSTITEETTVHDESDATSEGYTTSDTTEHGSTSDTTESGITDTDEELDTTGQSHITDIWTTVSSVSTAISKEQGKPKCKPRQRKKTCKSSPFGCCYDGVKAATGPFSKGCPIPETCKETEFGCCPDEVSPATGPNNEGCPSSHCSETLFGCCPDNDTPAEGNDYEGCPIPCDKSEFGCCPDEKTPAAGKGNLGCCNVTAHGCCPDGVQPASGPDGEGCHEKKTATATTPGDEVEVTTSAMEVTTASEDEATTTSEAAVTTVTAGEEGCTNSEFGCCPDQKSTATGINFAGCGVINTENCTASYYGCCPDGVSAALGANNQGCHMACEDSTFGCCVDGRTPAHGPDKEGCCLATLYGCCPDNIRPAQGLDLHGCGCQYSRYGCCPDNTTSARGSNNEGCACDHTQHGCCPNHVAAASGPNFEGCPCHTYQFGCCADGVSIARGPQSRGCGCGNTEFKCCSDGITPAKGENYAGCTCDASKYGCCPDGVEEAQGENFEGCLTVPSSPGAACALERDRGSCSDFTVRWFFDTEYGGCSRFWYGGCEGNDNRFKSQEECKDVCVEPKGRDACFLPKISGPCEGYHPTWYYDTERKQCSQFIYKGCLGNANKFKTEEECEELCVIPDDIDACEQSKEVGPCEGNFTRWYFNKESDSCEEFAYGGCKANKNNFPTQISCQQKCLTPGRSRVRDVCVLEKESGPCPGSSLRWYYDTKRKSCRQFVYGGCKGNGNKFRTYAACEQRCPVRDSCSLPREEGGCTEKHARWSFDQSEKRCMPFYYTGCGGNRNNYETIDACQSDCPPKIEQDVCLLPALLGECYNYTERWYYDSYESRCRQFYYGGCGGNENNFVTEYDCTHRCQPSPPTPAPEIPVFRTEFCFLRDDHGPCNDESVKWFYDSRDGVCKQFRYGGCAGNGNNFNTPEECESRCGNVQDLCGLPPVVGPCRADFRRYYYDSSTDTCNEFGFGGCQGNKNNFDDKTSCEKRCRKSIDVTTTTVQTTLPVTNIPKNNSTCSLPIDVGPCTDDVTAYYYDTNAGACQAFIYGGCEGNANRFQTEEQCERLCGSFQRQDVCNIQADPGPCRGAFLKFYYDPAIRVCREFYYGGCDGNANRFTSVEECESVCIHREEPTVPGNRTTASSQEICNEPASIGSGSVGSYKRFYYNDDRLDCIAFIYTGSGGNRNRFKNYQSCIETCAPRNEIDVRPVPESEDPCLAVRMECKTIRCPYGTEEFVDEQNCPHCQCADPCRTKVCEEGSRCAVSLVGSGDSIGYRGVCRSILKPGNCPKVSNATTCQEECSSDADCDTDFKCCANGCGSSCLQPASVEPLTTPPPQWVVTVPNSAPEPLAIEQPVEPNVSAEEGSYVILKCACAGNPKPFITWRKDVTLIDNSVSRHSISIDGSLQIVDLYRSDAGTYTCTADNRVAAPVRIQYILTITAPQKHTPAILGIPNYRVTVTLNSPTVLRCNVVGWPRPLVTWWHGDNMLPLSNTVYEQQRDHSLRIHRVALVNLGIYTCQAYNGIKQPASWSVILQAPGPVYNLNAENQKYAQYLVEPQRRPVYTTVRPQYPHKPQTTKATEIQTYEPFNPHLNPYIPPAVSVTEPSPEIVPPKYSVPVKVNVSANEGPFPEGSEFSIGCNVDGYPLPRVGWFKDDNPIQMNNRITISAANRLSISNAEKSDSGRYRCQAANELTSDADTVDIKVAGIYIHPNCHDNTFFAKCDLIVKGNFCKHKYYAKFCCRSCTEAGQLPARGSHINETRRKRRSILSIS